MVSHIVLSQGNLAEERDAYKHITDSASEEVIDIAARKAGFLISGCLPLLDKGFPSRDLGPYLEKVIVGPDRLFYRLSDKNSFGGIGRLLILAHEDGTSPHTAALYILAAHDLQFAHETRAPIVLTRLTPIASGTAVLDALNEYVN